MNKIIRVTKVRLPWGWISNMSHHAIKHTTINGVTFDVRNTEALFQGLRYPKGSHIRSKIFREKNPMGAKKVAKANIDEISVKQLSALDEFLMIYVVGLKLKYYPELFDELKSSGDRWIVEDVSARIGDNKSSSLYWGAALMGQKPNSVPYWVGNNKLGEIYMDYRNTIYNIDNITDIENNLVKLNII